MRLVLAIAVATLPASAACTTESTGFRADVAHAAGTFDHETSGGGSGGPSGSTDATWNRLRAEYVPEGSIGGGLSVEITRSDDHLFDSDGLTGITGGNGDERDAFAFLAGRPTFDPFEIAIRGGPYVRWLKVEEYPSEDETRWRGIGLRVEAEPLWRFARVGPCAFGLYGELSLSAHLTEITRAVGGASDSYDGRGTTVGAGAGLELLFSDHATARLGFVLRHSNERESEELFGPAVPSVDTKFRGVAFQLGIRL